MHKALTACTLDDLDVCYMHALYAPVIKNKTVHFFYIVCQAQWLYSVKRSTLQAMQCNKTRKFLTSEADYTASDMMQ